MRQQGRDAWSWSAIDEHLDPVDVELVQRDLLEGGEHPLVVLGLLADQILRQRHARPLRRIALRRVRHPALSARAAAPAAAVGRGVRGSAP